MIAIPLILIFLIRLHLTALHKVGCNNPEGISLLTKTYNKIPTKLPFHPYYSIKELHALLIFLFIFSIVVFFVPEMHGYFLEENNFVPADPLLTPSHIKLFWYLAAFYGVLCVIPNKSLGILIMLGILCILFVLPWLDRSPVRSMRYRGCYSQFALDTFILNFSLLSYISTTLLTPYKIFIVQILLINYFLFFYLCPFIQNMKKINPYQNPYVENNPIFSIYFYIFFHISKFF